MATLLDMDIDNIIKGWFDSAYAEQDRGSCRSCKFFVRVRGDGDFKKIRRQGFCLLGELCGDFQLYVSSSESSECKAFILNDYNHETTKMEDALLSKWKDFEYKMTDRRTKEYQQIKGVIEEMDKYLDIMEVTKLGAMGLQSHFKAKSLAYGGFVDLNEDQYREIFNRKAMRHMDYMRILGTITKVFEKSMFLVEK